MESSPETLLAEIGKHFCIAGRFVHGQVYGTGHINDTYISFYEHTGDSSRYIFQRINHHVFKEPLKVMLNIERITRHIRDKVIARGRDPERNCLSFVPSHEGSLYYQDPEGYYWRAYRFIDGARTYDIPEHPKQVYEAAKAFGDFQNLLANLPGGRLHETIPNFHNTPFRFQVFHQTLQEDLKNRAGSVKEEIDFIVQREADTKVIVEKVKNNEIPERIAHNDTKLNNVLIDDRSGEGICVIDLDTTMPGSSLYDFGDMVRSGVMTVDEDEPDISKVTVNRPLFENITRGYLESARNFLSPAEIRMLPFSGKLITLEQAIRFLTDYLNGDVYYRISRPYHNLERARTQIKLVVELESQMDGLTEIIEKYSKEGE